MSIKIERYISSAPLPGEEEVLPQPTAGALKIRPESFDDYPGQKTAKENLRVYVQAAKQRQAPLDHVILHGPPGLGKTTLAAIVAKELGVPFFSSSGPCLEKPGDLAGILAGLAPRSVLFIDEIHRLPIQVEEVLYSAMEDFAVDLLVGAGPTARSVRMELAPFTLIGATTKLSKLSSPFLSRFGIQERLNFYDDESLVHVLKRSARVLGISLDTAGAAAIAARSRGTPRVANRLLRRAWDFAEVSKSNVVDAAVVGQALGRLDIDEMGLDRVDREILGAIQHRYAGGPVGIEALAVTIGEDRATVEEVYEPYLVFRGFLARGPRGRTITSLAEQHLERRGGHGEG